LCFQLHTNGCLLIDASNQICLKIDIIIDTKYDTKMSEWVTIAEAKKIYGRSETTMRNLVRKLKDLKSKDLNISKNASGREIMRFKRTYLDKIYNNTSDNTKGDRKENSGNAEMVAFLQAQILKKDEQISQLGYLLAQAQDEKKQLLLISEKPKKRWWLFRRKND
jgi:hypothetical protein